MQTFLPFPNYAQTASVLDRQRLGKQRIEVVQILNALHDVRKDPNKPPGWRNHPATLMWEGYEPQLCEYGLMICEEWASRGYKDEQKAKIEWHMECATSGTYTLDQPPWLTAEVCLMYQSLLLRKDYNHYHKYFPHTRDDIEFEFPVLR